MKESNPIPPQQAQRINNKFQTRFTYLPPTENVIPHWSTTKINMKISEASFHTHQTVPENRAKDKNESVWNSIFHALICRGNMCDTVSIHSSFCIYSTVLFLSQSNYN